ncbi:MAG: GTPase domain-containing protein [Pseudomonadota bacterium]
MAVIDRDKKEIQVKIVYYGPGRSGKTSNLEYIFEKYKDRVTSKIAIINTLDDNTLFFDFFPLELGKMGAYDVRIQFYTVPGQVKYNATRKLVLRGADGVVFVADSMVVRREKNILSFNSLVENLVSYKREITRIPLVFQYNKRDLHEEGIPVLPIETLEKDLNSQIKAPFFEASVAKGINVIPTMKKIVALALASLKKQEK